VKESFYFQHDYDAKDDPRILNLRAEFGVEGYGVFWMLLESMAKQEDTKLDRGAIGGLSLGYSIPKERLIAIIDFCIKECLFCEENNAFWSERMKEHKNFRFSLSEAGKQGAKKRWKNRGAIATPMQRKGKERKGNTYDVRPETNSLYDSIDNMCEKYNLKNKVNKKSLDIIVERYLTKIKMKVEMQHCITWLIDKGKKDISTQRIGNWFKKAYEIQKRDELKQKYDNSTS